MASAAHPLDAEHVAHRLYEVRDNRCRFVIGVIAFMLLTCWLLRPVVAKGPYPPALPGPDCFDVGCAFFVFSG